METSDVILSIVDLFTEAYEGAPEPSSTWFIDNEPNSGVLGLIASVSAKEASWSSRKDDPGTTIAAHVEHLRWSLANANGALRGKPYQSNWKESWNTLQVSENKWKNLKKDLRDEFEALRESIMLQTELSGSNLLGVMALVPHAAYHLGTIRQLIERARSDGKNLTT